MAANHGFNLKANLTDFLIGLPAFLPLLSRRTARHMARTKTSGQTLRESYASSWALAPFPSLHQGPTDACYLPDHFS